MLQRELGLTACNCWSPTATLPQGSCWDLLQPAHEAGGGCGKRRRQLSSVHVCCFLPVLVLVRVLLLVVGAADDDTRLMRRIKRDVAERGRDVMNVLEQYQKFVKPAFDQFVAPSRRYRVCKRPVTGHAASALVLKKKLAPLGSCWCSDVSHAIFSKSAACSLLRERLTAICWPFLLPPGEKPC